MKIIGIHETKWQVSEASGNVDGWPILGKVVGPSFFPEAISRNKRFYPEALWDRVLGDERVNERKKNGTIFGTIGHDIDIDEAALRDGIPSHITKVMEYRTKNGAKYGYCEHFIIDTRVGRWLFTYLKSGANLYVSSRADGDYAGNTSEGIPILNVDSYVFERFDFVLDPGFLEANPKLLEGLDSKVSESVMSSYSKLSKIEESMDPLNSTTGIENDNKNNVSPASANPAMPTTVDPTNVPGNPEQIGERRYMAEILGRNAQLAKRNEELESVVQTNAISKEDSEALKNITGAADITEARAIAGKFFEEIGTLPDAADALKEIDATFNELGTPAQLAEALRKVEGFFTSVGTPRDIREAFARIQKFHEEVGSPEELNDTLDSIEKFSNEFGTPAEVAESLRRTAKFFEDNGEPADIEAALVSTEKMINDLGTPVELESAITESLAFHTRYGTSSKIAETLEGLRKVAEELGSIDQIREALTKSQTVIGNLTAQLRAYKLNESTGVDLDKLQAKIEAGYSDEDIVEHFSMGGAGRMGDALVFGRRPNESRPLHEGKTESKIGKNGLMGEAFAPASRSSRLSRAIGG